MSAHPTQAEPTDDPGQQAAADVRYYRDVLHELIDIGTDLARLVHVQAKTQAATADAPDAPAPDLALRFDRIARAVRRTVALAHKLIEPLPAPDTQATAQRRVAARTKIIREVEDTIHRATKGAAADTLHAELIERLDGPDLDDDILGRPVADIIADICRDLGLTALPGTSPWKRRTPRDLQHLAARARSPAAPRSPDPTYASRTQGRHAPHGGTLASNGTSAAAPSSATSKKPPRTTGPEDWADFAANLAAIDHVHRSDARAQELIRHLPDHREHPLPLGDEIGP